MTTKYDPKSVGGRIATIQGMALTGIGQAWRLVLTVVSVLVLSRLLSPSDFGLVAMVTPVIALAKKLDDLGTPAVVVQREKITAGQLSALFYLNVALSLSIALLLGICAPAIAAFYGEPRITPLVVAFSAIVLISGLQSQQTALLNRQMRFRDLAFLDVLAATISCLVSIIAALILSSYWAIFWGTFAAAITTLIVKWLMTDLRLTWPSFEGEFKELAGFGASVSSYSILTFFARNLDNILIGRIHGGYELGLYDRAYKLMLFPLSQSTTPLARVMIPLLSRLRSDTLKYRKAYFECITAIMWCTHPAMLVAIVFSDEVVEFLLGSKWAATAPIFQWLGICSLHQVVTPTLNWLVLSQGRGRDYLKLAVFGSAISVTAIVAGVYWGGLGVAISYTISDYLVRLPFVWTTVGQSGLVRLRDLLVNTLPHVVAVGASVSALLIAAMMVGNVGALECAYFTILSYAIYSLAILCFAPKRQFIRSNFALISGWMRSRAIAKTV